MSARAEHSGVCDAGIRTQAYSAARAIDRLDALGCRVLCVVLTATRERPRITIADPGALLDHLDGRIDTASPRWIERGVELDDCEITWLIDRPMKIVE